MPMYAYKCGRCGAEEEHIERFSDPPKAQCDACGGPLARVLAPSALARQIKDEIERAAERYSIE